ncbi:MAG: hypothetical protein WCE45_05260 [Sedimentisphaerales bacterium]
MNPEEFFKTAEKLKDSDKEPDLRTSVGRSYYAIFLHFREYLKKLGLSKTRNPKNSVHSFVKDCLGFSQVSEASRLAVALNDLYGKREKADYHLSITINPTEASDVLEDAKEAIQTFHSSMTSGKEQILLANAKQYAKSKEWIL